jgi:ubiquinone/menaquinone biosynthesis C-methylase UbiE
VSGRSEGVWSDFWAQGGAGPASGCLPHALRQIDEVQKRLWASVVRQLPRGAGVLDLATGDGAVLGKIQAVRRDLKLVGVDSAASLPAKLRGATIKAGVAMERLPFPDRSFDLVTSQFGFEYGDIAATAREVARVLRPGGRFAFLVHHADGPIVAHNAPRKEALEAVIEGSDLLAPAKGLVAARAVSQLPTPPSFAALVQELGRRFPRQPVAAEFAAAVLQTLELSRGKPVTEALDTLAELESRGRNDIGRIRALMAAARSPDGIAGMLDTLRAAGLECAPVETVRETEGRQPFGWLVSGRSA